MGTIILVAIVFGAGIYFLFGYAESKHTWVKKAETNVRVLRVSLTGFFTVVGLAVGIFLVSSLAFLIPPKSYEETKIVPLSPFVGGDGKIYAIIEKDDIIFMIHGRLVRRKYDEINKEVSFLSEDRNTSPQLVKLKAKRSGFWKYFFIDPCKLKFFVPRSGIKKGEIKFLERYEFISEK